MINIKMMKLSGNQKEIVENIKKYVDERREDLNKHYLSVKMENGQNRDNDIYDLIDRNTYNNELMKVSIVILTANYYECEILNLNIFNAEKKKIKQLSEGLQLLRDRHITKAYIFETCGYKVLHLHAPETGSNTPCGSADLVRYVGNCEFLDPSCVISFGICYGIDYKNYSLGDTIIAEKIYPWSIGIKINDDGWKIKCDDYVIDLRDMDPHLYSRIRQVKETAHGLCTNQKVDLGNMLSSEAVISNEKIRIEAIEKAYGCNILGGEMEGYGLAKECVYYNQKPCIILKAICDWGAVKNIDEYIDNKSQDVKGKYKDQIQAYTTYCAYRVLNELFKGEVFEKNDTIASICDALKDKYVSDTCILKNDFNNFIKDYLEANFKNYKNLSEEGKERVEKVVVREVINKCFTVSRDGVCHFFNEYLC